MGLSPFGRILAVTCTMPVVKLFGNDQAAWAKTMSAIEKCMENYKKKFVEEVPKEC